jgi:hypothetical protein
VVHHYYFLLTMLYIYIYIHTHTHGARLKSFLNVGLLKVADAKC